MADTIRSRAALLVLLADNTSGDISPQDIRDFLVSVHGVYGGIQTVGGAVAQSLSTTPAKLTAFAANMDAAGTTPDHTNDQITVLTDGEYAFWFNVVGNAASSAIFRFTLRKNGVAQSFTGRLSGASGAQTPTGFNGLIALVANDILTVFGESDSGGGVNFTVTEAQLICHRVA